eukprot:COSAG02_NODE_7670_length_2901_cov_60.433262_5_plen_110_part_00
MLDWEYAGVASDAGSDAGTDAADAAAATDVAVASPPFASPDSGPRRQQNATLLRTHALRHLRLVDPLGVAHVVWDGYGVKTACFGGPTTPKTGHLGGGRVAFYYQGWPA